MACVGRHGGRGFPSPCGRRAGDRQAAADRSTGAGALGPSALLGTPGRGQNAATGLRGRIRRRPRTERQDCDGAGVQARGARRWGYGVHVEAYLCVVVSCAWNQYADDRRLPRDVRDDDSQKLRTPCAGLSTGGGAGDREKINLRRLGKAGRGKGFSVGYPVGEDETKVTTMTYKPLKLFGGPGGNRTPNQTVMSGRL